MNKRQYDGHDHEILQSFSFAWCAAKEKEISASLLKDIGPIHLKDEMPFQAELFRPEGENLA